MARTAIVVRAGLAAGVVIAGGAAAMEAPGLRLETLAQLEARPAGAGRGWEPPRGPTLWWPPVEEEPPRARSLPFPPAAASGAAVLVGLWLRGAARRRRR